MDKRVIELLQMEESSLQELAEAGKKRQQAEEEAAIKEIERSHKVG